MTEKPEEAAEDQQAEKPVVSKNKFGPGKDAGLGYTCHDQPEGKMSTWPVARGW